ncbi:hypothetical protein HDU86_002681 [Geranomyces michiganensis]|nr:hypothetical protein HDU86_002681 [Geranomyces michiganensis]
MEFTELPKIRRQLRQLRAKLVSFADVAAAQTAATSNRTSLNGCSEGAKQPPPSPSWSLLHSHRSAPASRVTVRYGRGKARGRGSTELGIAAASETITPGIPPKSPSLLAAYINRDVARQYPSPMRKQTYGFQEYFKELAAKLWAAGLAEPTGTASARFSAAQLSQLAAFSVARNLPLATTDQYDDLNIAGGSVDVEEQWYEYVPATYRRAILFAHVIELCKAFIGVPIMFIAIVDTCIAVGANHQAFDVLTHFWKVNAAPSSNDMAWAFSAAARLKKMDAWINAIGPRLTVRQVQRIADSHIAKSLTERQSDLLNVYAMQYHLGNTSAHSAEAMANRITKPAWFGAWVRRLLQHSHFSCPIPHTCPCASTLLTLCGILHTVILQSSQSVSESENETEGPLWFVVILRGSQIRIKRFEDKSDRREIPWLDALVQQDPPLDLLSEIAVFWPTFNVLAGLRSHLREIGAHAVAKKLTIATLNDYDQICRKTQEHGGQIVSLEEIQQEINMKSETSSPAGNQWRYEPVLQTWIPGTPAAMQSHGSSSSRANTRTRSSARSHHPSRPSPSPPPRPPQPPPPATPRTERCFYLTTSQRNKAKPTMARGRRPRISSSCNVAPLKRIRIPDDVDDLLASHHNADDWAAPLKKARTTRKEVDFDQNGESEDEFEEDGKENGRAASRTALEIRTTTALPLTTDEDELAL